MTIIIYRVKNKITGHVYIGYSSESLAKRKSKHKYEAFKRKKSDKKAGLNRQDRPLYQAIRNYNWENFKWCILATCYHIQDAQKAEEAFINYYDSMNPKKGYNLTPGFGGIRKNLNAC